MPFSLSLLDTLNLSQPILMVTYVPNFHVSSCATYNLLFFMLVNFDVLFVGVLDRRVLKQRVKIYCVSLSRMVMQTDTRFILVQAIGALRPVWECDLVFLAPRCS